MSTSLAISRKPQGALSQKVYHMILYAVAREIAYQQLRVTDSNPVKQQNTFSTTSTRARKRRNNKILS